MFLAQILARGGGHTVCRAGASSGEPISEHFSCGRPVSWHVVLSTVLLVAWQTGCTLPVTEGRLRTAVTYPKSEGLRLPLYLCDSVEEVETQSPSTGRGDTA